MKTIVIIAEHSAIASNITGVMDFFQICNTYWRVTSGKDVSPLFNCIVASQLGGQVQTSSGIAIDTIAIDKVGSADAVIVSSGMIYDEQGMQDYINGYQGCFEFLRQRHQDGAAIGAFCSGSIILAACGLLDGKRAISSWWLADVFRQYFPKVELCLDKLVVNDNNLYTGGATTAYLSLCLKLVEDLSGEQVAAQMAKIMLVDPNRSSQVPYMTLQGLAGHQDERVKKIQRFMQSNLAQSFSLDELAERFALSKRTLIRRFKQAVGDTPVNYLQRLRVEQAKRLLETTSAPLEEIVNQVGYGDVSSFRKLFVQLTELSPKAYRLRFNLAYGE